MQRGPVLRPNLAPPLLPTPAPHPSPVLGAVLLCLCLGPGVLSLGGTDLRPRPSTTRAAHTYSQFFHPLATGSAVLVQGPRLNGKVPAGAYDLASPIPVLHRSGGSEGPAEQGPRPNPHIPALYPHSSQAGACPPVPGTPACTRTHRCPTLPPMPVYLPKEKAGGPWAGQGLPLLPTPRRRGKPWAPSRPHN